MTNIAMQWKKDLKLRQIPYDEFVSINFNKGIFLEKLDGMLGVYIYNKRESFFQTTTGKKIYDIPVVNEYENILRSLNIEEAKIPGELIAIKNGKLLSFNDTQSIVKRFHEPKNKDLIFHYPVDIISINKASFDFKKVLSFLRKNFSRKRYIKLPRVVIGDLEDFRDLFTKTMKPGFDGVVARNINGKNYKVKFINTVDLVVIGAGNYSLPSWPRKQISYLLTSFIDNKGMFRSSSKVGTGFTLTERSELYSFIMKNKIYELKGDVYIKPRLMIEIKYFRFRLTKTPSYVYTGKQYIERKEENSITFSHPSFERKRLDKEVNKINARLEQIPNFKY